MMGVCFFYVIIFACHHFLVIIFRFFDDKNRRCHPIVEGQHRQNHSWRPEAKMIKKNNWSVGSEAQYEPRTAGEVLQEFLNESSSPFAQAYRQHRAVFPNTEMCVDLKLLTREPWGAQGRRISRRGDHTRCRRPLPLHRERHRQEAQRRAAAQPACI